MPFDARIAWVLAGAGALAAVALAAFPPAGLGDRLDFLFFHGAGFGPGTVFRFVAGLAVAAGAFAMTRGGGPSRVWRRGRERLAIAPRAYAAIMAGIGAIAWLSVVAATADGVCLVPDSASYLTFEPHRTIGYPLFLRLIGVGEGAWGALATVQSGILIGALAVLAHQVGRVCRDRLAATLAFALMAGNASLAGYAGYVLAETPFAALLALHLAAVAALCVRFGWGVCLAAGLTLGGAILMRPAGYAFLGALPALLLLLARRRVLGALTVGAATALPLLAAAAFNHVQHGFFATQSIGGYSLLGQTAHLIAPEMPSAFGDLPARVATATAPFRAEIGAASFPHEAWRKGMNLYNPQLYEAALPAIGAWLAERPADARPELDRLVGALAREAIAHDPVGYARQVGAQYYGLWLLSLMPQGPMAARLQACRAPADGARTDGDGAIRIVPIDVFWAVAALAQFPALGVVVLASWLAIPLWFVSARRNAAWRFAIYAALGVNAYYLGFATTQVALPRYANVVEPWMIAVLAALPAALGFGHTEDRDGDSVDRAREDAPASRV